MRRFSSRMFPHAVTLTPMGYDRAAGGRLQVPGAPVALRGVVQAKGTSRGAGAARVEVDYVAYFADDPGCKADDRIGWAGRTLSAVGPARPSARGGGPWAVECTEVR